MTDPDPDPCPALIDLLEQFSEYADHVARCPRCRVLASPAGGFNDSAGPEVASPAYGGINRGRLRVGQVCRVSFGDIDEYLLAVVLTTDGRDAHVLALTDEIEMATDRDLIVASAFLGYEAMIQTSVAGDVLGEQVHEIRATLSSADASTLSRIVGTSPMSPAPGSGPAVVGEHDPRLLFRSEQQEQAAPFWRPALLLAGVATFGEFVGARRVRSTGASDALLDELDLLLGGEGLMRRLERDQLDLHTEVEPARLVGVLARLQIGLDEGIARLLGDAITTSPGAPTASLATFSLGGTSSSAPSPATPGRAQRYLDALWQAHAGIQPSPKD